MLLCIITGNIIIIVVQAQFCFLRLFTVLAVTLVLCTFNSKIKTTLHILFKHGRFSIEHAINNKTSASDMGIYQQMSAVIFFRYIILDTPGQIEVFTWSASGSIITEALVCETLGLNILIIQNVPTVQ